MNLTARLNRAHYEGVARYDIYARQHLLSNTVDEVILRLSGEAITQKGVTPLNVLYGAYIGAPAQYLSGFCAELFSSRR